MIDLIHVKGRVVIELDQESKNWHTFESGIRIRRERKYNEFNRNITEPVNAIVVSADNIPKGVQILIHPNSIHESSRIFNHGQLSGKEEGSDIKYYSIGEEECFLWLDENNVWQPLYPYATALRVFKPYVGPLIGIDPTLIKDMLYVTSGELKGNIVKTLKACDYQITFQDITGREGNVIRFRPFGDERNKREEEAVAIMNDLNIDLLEGDLLIGITISDAHPINETAYAD